MAHVCPTCRPGPYRVVDHERSVVTVPEAFRGPPTSMHGGAAAGIIPCLASHHLGRVSERFRLRLHAPPPLEADLDLAVEVEANRNSLTFSIEADGRPVLTGAAFAHDFDGGEDPVVEPATVNRLADYVSLTDEQRQRHEDFVDVEDNPDFAGCFGCGPGNEHGLGLRTRPVDDGVSWLEWQPPSRWHDGTELAMLPAVAALDCTSAFPLKQFGLTGLDETALLGSYEARIHRRPPADKTYRIITAPRRRDGRKILADIGLFDPEGEVYITGRATWIVLAV